MKCTVDGCLNESGVTGSARGLCRAHYRRWQRYGNELEPSRRERSWSGVICSETGCQKPVRTNGLCVNHYKKIDRRNNPEAQKLRNKAFKVRRRAKQEALIGRPRPEHCELCNDPGYGRKPSIVFDHCHASGKPRGWLCDRCNKTLGLVKDDINLLYKMINYLEFHSVEINNKAA